MTDAIGRIGLALMLGMVVTVVAVGGVAAGESDDADIVVASASRGALLYENHCTVCHDSIVHIRANRKAKSLSDIRDWSERWSGELNLNWSRADVDDVAEYLAARFYKCGEKGYKC